MNFQRLHSDYLSLISQYLTRADLGRLCRVCVRVRHAVEYNHEAAARLPLLPTACALRASPGLAGVELQGIRSMPTFWEMNLAAVTSDQKRLFIAKAGCVFAYALPVDCGAYPAEVVRLAATDTLDGNINQLGVGQVHGEEAVVCVTNGQHVLVLYAHALARQPILAFKTRASTWSIAMDPQGCSLAVGSNAHEVINFRFPPCAASPTETCRVETFRGHRHNVPCTAYSPCGDFIASASVDGTVRLWDVDSKRHHLLRSMPTDVAGTWLGLGSYRNWGWYVGWILKDGVQVVTRLPQPPPHRWSEYQCSTLQATLMEDLSALETALRTGQPPASTLSARASQLLGTHLLLLATTHHIILLKWTRLGLRTVATTDVTKPPMVPTPHSNPCRLALVQPLPGVSALAASTQGNGVVRIYKIVQHSSTGSYHFLLQDTLDVSRQSILGMYAVLDATARPSAPRGPPSYTLWVVDCKFCVNTYRVSTNSSCHQAGSTEGPNIPTHTPTTIPSDPIPSNVIDLRHVLNDPAILTHGHGDVSIEARADARP